jgi:transcriptional regulator with XRE-family HTH domain
MKFSRDVLRRLRKDRAYSLGALSRLLSTRCGYSVSRSAICQWEQGKTKPKISSLLALADVFQVEPWIFFDNQANK